MLGIFLQVIATKCDERACFIWDLCEVETKHCVELIGLAKSVDLLNLLHKCLELLLGTLWSKADDSCKPILVHSIGLVALKNLDATDAWLAIVWRKADCLLIEISVDIS